MIGDVDSLILNKGNNDDFFGLSVGKKIVFVFCGVYLFVFFWNVVWNEL